MITKENICAAIAWAKENPDKIIKGYLAKNKNGEEVFPTNPTATCFCILGRAAKEAKLFTMETSEVMYELAKSFDWKSPELIWRRNDEGVNSGNPLLGAEYLESLL